MNDTNIRLECLMPADRWQRPSGNEIRKVLGISEFSGTKAAAFLGLGAGGDRTVRRWVGEESPIPYAAWALLCERAGFGMIWKDG